MIEDARTRQRRQRTIAMTAVLALLAALVAVVLGAGGVSGGGATGAFRGPVEIASHDAVSVLRVRGGVVDVATTDRAVWVAGFGVVTRIDAATRHTTLIRTPRTNDFSHLAVGDGSVWATGLGTVYRIDSAVSRVIATIHLGDTPASGIALGAGQASVALPPPNARPGEIVEIDPATNRVTGSPITVGAGPTQLTYSDGTVWSENTRINPLTHRVSLAPTVLSLGEPTAVSVLVADGSMWDAGADALTRLDPATGAAIARITIPRAQQIVSGDGALWVLASPLSSTSTVFTPVKGTARLWEVDPRINRPIGHPIGLDALEPIGLAVSQNAVWIADYAASSVTRVALRR